MHGLAALYVSELITPHNTPLPLKSDNQMLLYVPRSKLRTNGDHAFPVVAPSSRHPYHFVIAALRYFIYC